MFGKVQSFFQKHPFINFTVLLSVFTVFFIQGIKRSILTPVIIAYMTPSIKHKIVGLKHDQYLYIGEFVAEIVQYIIIVFLIFCIWAIKEYVSKN
jgi:large-conductance mechanosensitive channel